MRPLSLKLKNFGSYKEEFINFEDLTNNLFIISGATGSGKSFIFDAITFALYGRPASERVLPKLRNSDCQSDEPTFVEFVFSLFDKTYKITRKLKITKDKGKEAASAADKVVYVFNNDTKDFEKDANINPESDLIKLNIDQFKQVILLAQNQFSKFLKDDKEKRETLKKIFNADIAEQVANRIKEKKEELTRSLEPIEGIIQKALEGYGTNQAMEEEKNALLASLPEYESRLDSLRVEMDKDKLLIQSLQDGLKKAKDKQNLLQKKKLHDSNTEYIHKEKFAVSVAKKVVQVKLALDEKKKAEDAFVRKEKDVASLKLSAQEAQNGKMQAEEQAQKIPCIESEINSLSFDIKEKQEISLKIKDRDQKKVEIIKAKDRKEKSESALNFYKKQMEKLLASLPEKPEDMLLTLVKEESVLEKAFALANDNMKAAKEKEAFVSDAKNLNAELVKNRDALQDVENRIELLQGQIAEEKTRKEIYETEIKLYELAATLKEDMPCPLCGSTHHPNVVQLHEYKGVYDIPVLEKDVAVLTKNKENLSSLVSLTQGKLDSTNEQLKKYVCILSVEACDAEYSKCKQGLDENKKNQEKAKSDIEMYKSLSEQKDKAEKDVLDVTAFLNEKEKVLEEFMKSFGENKDVSEETIAQELNLLKQKCQCLVQEKKKIEDALTQAISFLSAQEAALKEALATLKAYESNVNEAEIVFAKEKEQALMFSDVASVVKKDEDFALVYLTQSKIDEKENIIADWEKEEDMLSVQLDILSDVESADIIEEKSAKVRASLTQKEIYFKKADSEYNERKAKAAVLKDKLADLEKIAKEKEEITHQQEVFAYLYDKMYPKNGVHFELWYLAAFFNEVVQNASNHFLRFSDGLYSFKIDTASLSGRGQKGLNLIVCDSEKGTEFPVSSLSGGETFEASLSLALGIIESIHSHAGGISLDAIFIDEGFGSLDAETREVARPILEELSRTKMVGIISHVKDMQDEISSQIIVTKDIDEGSKAVVTNGNF